MFGEIAPWYDFLNHLLSLNIDKRGERGPRGLFHPGLPSRGRSSISAPAPATLPSLTTAPRRERCSIYAADFCHEMLLRSAESTASRCGRTNPPCRGRCPGSPLPLQHVPACHNCLRPAERDRHRRGNCRDGPGRATRRPGRDPRILQGPAIGYSAGFTAGTFTTRCHLWARFSAATRNARTAIYRRVF